MPKPGKTAARGYGGRHQRLRAMVAPLVAAGKAICWRCGERIEPGAPWDLGHSDEDRNIYNGPEHRGRECKAGGNRATAGRRNGARPNRKPTYPNVDMSREW